MRFDALYSSFKDTGVNMTPDLVEGLKHMIERDVSGTLNEKLDKVFNNGLRYFHAMGIKNIDEALSNMFYSTIGQVSRKHKLKCSIIAVDVMEAMAIFVEKETEDDEDDDIISVPGQYLQSICYL